jgi:hypothetical protein
MKGGFLAFPLSQLQLQLQLQADSRTVCLDQSQSMKIALELTGFVVLVSFNTTTVLGFLSLIEGRVFISVCDMCHLSVAFTCKQKQ